MKIVIDIPERDYDLACNYPNALIATYAHYIKDGTPYEERPHGHWVKDGEFYKCSECTSHELYPENFCYCCGADMRGGKQ